MFSCRRTDSSSSHTRFPIFRRRSSSLAHLGLTFHVDRNFLAHLLQSIWLYAWATLYIFQPSMYHIESGIQGFATTGRPNRKSLSVNASRSSRSSLTGVNCLVFNICATEQIVVVNTGLVARYWFPRIAIIAFSKLRSTLSQSLRKCRTPGGWTFQTIFPRASRSHIASRSHSLKHSLNSRAAPAKFVPLSLMIGCSLSRIAMNLVIAIMNASVSNPFTTSMWTALVTRHVKKQQQCFTGLRNTVTSNGPKKSTPVFLKGYTLPFTRFFGKLAMWGKIGCTASFLHLTLWNLMLRKGFCNPIIQNGFWTGLFTYSALS